MLAPRGTCWIDRFDVFEDKGDELGDFIAGTKKSFGGFLIMIAGDFRVEVLEGVNEPQISVVLAFFGDHREHSLDEP